MGLKVKILNRIRGCEVGIGFSIHMFVLLMLYIFLAIKQSICIVFVLLQVVLLMHCF